MWNPSPLEVDGCDRGNKQHLSLDTRQSHRSLLRPLCMRGLSELSVQLPVDIGACKVSLRLLPLHGHSLWDVTFSTNVHFLSGPCSLFLFHFPATRSGAALRAILQSKCSFDTNQIPSLFSLSYTEQDQDGLLQSHGTKSTLQLLDSFSFSILLTTYLQQDSFTYLVHKAGSRSYAQQRFLSPRKVLAFSLFFALEGGY